MGEEKPHKPETDYAWLKDRIESLVKLASGLRLSSKDVQYPPHTLLKHVALRSIAWTFLMVAKGPKSRNAGYDGAVYIDLYAGGGVTNIRSSSSEWTYKTTAGSPFAATQNHKFSREFDLSILIEEDPRRANLLRNRLKGEDVKGNFRVLEGDCNKIISQAIQIIKEHFRKPIIFVLGDPEGMETHWTLYEDLSKAFEQVDYLINVSSGSERVLGALRQGNFGYLNSVAVSLGVDEEVLKKELEAEVANPGSKKTFMERLDNRFAEAIGKEKGRSIPINGKPNWPVYHLGFYTRNTASDSVWFKAIDQIIPYFRNLDGKMAESALAQISGKTWYFDT